MSQKVQEPWWKSDAFKVAVAVTIIGAILTWILGFANPDDSESPQAAAPSVTSSSPRATDETEELSPTPTSTYKPREQYLSGINDIDGEAKTGSYSVDGTAYSNSVAAQVSKPCGSGADPEVLEYQLGRKWKTLKATVGLSDDSDSDFTMAFEVYLDDALKESFTFGVNHHRNVSISVVGVARVKLRAIYSKGPDVCGIDFAVWGNARVTH
ncbi:NPCBM/NEW2 domain-containing protein [Streptomyces sp. NPDC048392]|uniref:NPCBM/NEW2 domain-containing protein n=1 Tax=Streptomyces sp. NPDC048392 TaxID=3365543 RepID=UPI0037183BCA